MDSGSIVIVHLRDPAEKLWGVLHRLDLVGVNLRGLNISSFEDWVAQAARDEPTSLGLVNMFVPMSRVERVFLDEQVGSVESYCQLFEQRVGIKVEQFLEAEFDLGDLGDLPS